MDFKITESQVFWFIWLNCAEKPTSIFQIQKKWKITSNFLYHRIKKYDKPLFLAMLEQGFLKREGKKFFSNFEWIKDYINEKYRGTILEKYNNEIQRFISKYYQTFFSFDDLSKLFGNEGNWKEYGKNIFKYIFFCLLYKDMQRFLEENNALIVLKIIELMVKSFSEVNLVEYAREIAKNIEYPNIISTKSDLENIIKVLGL